MRFVVYLNNTIQGPLNVTELWQLPGFSLDTSVCPIGEDTWRPAKEFRAITHPDFAATEPEEVEGQPPRKRNWREGVIETDVAAISSPSWRAATVFQSGDAVSPPVTPAPKPPSKLSQIQELLVRQRKGFLLAVLSVTFFGVYSPQTDNIVAICQGLTGPDSAMPASLASRAWSGRARPKAGPWKRAKEFRLFHPVVSPAVPQTAASKPEVVEIGSVNLGNGYLEKTVVITRVVDGLRIQETKTMTVPVPKAKRARRRKLSFSETDVPPVS